MKKTGIYGESKRGMAVRLLFIILLFAALLLAIYFLGHALEAQRGSKADMRGDLSLNPSSIPTVTYQGKAYRYKSGMTAILFIGVDQDRETPEASGGFRNRGQADFLLLAVLDGESKRITPLHIDRDTMAEITVLGVLGNVSGTRRAQICLSHSFGDGREQSSLLTKEAVSRLLLGIDIDFYIGINMGAIAALNDAAGGVPITMDTDFTAQDPAMALGVTLTLTGEQAERYVRSRMNVGDGTNAGRIQRQQRYLTALFEILTKRAGEEAGYWEAVYAQVADVLLTDMKRGRLINEANKALGYALGEPLSLPGEHRIGSDGFMQFHADENALAQLVLDLFYTPL